MNCKILIVGLIALCCFQLAIAEVEDEPKLRRKRTKRRRTSSPTSSKSLERSRTKKRTSSEDSSSDSSYIKNSDDEKSKIMKSLNNLDLLGNGRADLPENANIAEGIPTLQANRSVFIEGRNGGIFVNKKKKYSFKGGAVEIKIRDGNFYVNDNLVLKKAPPEKFGFVVYSMHTLNYRGVTDFTLELDAKGFLHYKDNTGENFNVNYFTRINFG